MFNKPALSTVLAHPSTIRFLAGSDDADMQDIDLSKNPQRSANGSFVWLLPDRTSEASVTFIGKVIYGAIGDKSGSYFSLPDEQWVRPLILTPITFLVLDALLQLPDITPDEMSKAKVGFAIRFINRDLAVDHMLSDELDEHNQAALEFFLAIQEAADARMVTCECDMDVLTASTTD